MRIYQNHVRDQHGESKGYAYYGTMREARKANREIVSKGFEVTLEKIDIRFTKEGILKAFNTWGGHPDNG